MIATADLLDAHPDLQVLPALFADFGGEIAVAGRLRTVKVFEDNTLVKALLEQPGEDNILLVDGGGSQRCALVGGNLGQLAVNNGWAGIVVYGCVRDVLELAELPIAVKALGSHPRKSYKGMHAGAVDVPVTIEGMVMRPGQWLYADADGILLAEAAL